MLKCQVCLTKSALSATGSLCRSFCSRGAQQTRRSPEPQDTIIQPGGHTLHDVEGWESQLKIPPVCQPEPLVPGDRSQAHRPSAFISPPRVGGAGTREKPTSQKLQVPTGAGALYSRILRKRSQVHAETEARDVNNTPRQPRNPYELPECLRCSRTGSVQKRPMESVTKAQRVSKSKHKKTA